MPVEIKWTGYSEGNRRRYDLTGATEEQLTKLAQMLIERRADFSLCPFASGVWELEIKYQLEAEVVSFVEGLHHAEV